MANKLSKQHIAIAYEQRLRRRIAAYWYLVERKWWKGYVHSTYKSPVTYLRYCHGITWKEYYPEWGGIMYQAYGKEWKPSSHKLP